MRFSFLVAILFPMLVSVGCESTRKAEERRRAEMTSYSYEYAFPTGGYPDPADKRKLRQLEEEGWRPVRENRSTRGPDTVVTVYYEK